MGIAKFIKEKDLAVSVSKVLDYTLELATYDRDFAILPKLHVLNGDVDEIASGYYPLYEETLQEGLMSYASERAKMHVTYTGLSALGDKVKCLGGTISFFLDDLEVRGLDDRRMTNRCFSSIKGVGVYDLYIFGMLERQQAIEVFGEDICRYAKCSAVRYYTMVFVQGANSFEENTLFKISDTKEILMSLRFEVKERSEFYD